MGAPPLDFEVRRSEKYGLEKRRLKIAFSGNWLGRKNWDRRSVAVRERVKKDYRQ